MGTEEEELGPLEFDSPEAEQTFKGALGVLKSFERIDPLTTLSILMGALSIHLRKVTHGMPEEAFVAEVVDIANKFMNSPQSLAHVNLTTGELEACDLKPGPDDATH